MTRRISPRFCSMIFFFLRRDFLSYSRYVIGCCSGPSRDWRIVISMLPRDWFNDVEEENLGGGGQELVDEIHVADHVILISLEAEERNELLAERGEDVEDLRKGDLASAVLVEDLQAFNVVLLASGGGGVGLGGGEDGEEVGEGDSLLSQLGGATGGDDGGVGHVAAQSAEDVADVEGVDIIALVSLVEDDESILGLGFRHFG